MSDGQFICTEIKYTLFNLFYIIRVILPEVLPTIDTVPGAEYSLDSVYTCYSKNKGLATGKIFLSLDIKYKQPERNIFRTNRSVSDYDDVSEGEGGEDTSGGKIKIRKSKRTRKTKSFRIKV